MRIEAKRSELLKPRPCSCHCGRMVVPNPRDMIAKGAPRYFSETCRVAHAKERAKEREALRRGKKAA